jgi:hypothetical protein
VKGREGKEIERLAGADHKHLRDVRERGSKMRMEKRTRREKGRRNYHKIKQKVQMRILERRAGEGNREHLRNFRIEF